MPGVSMTVKVCSPTRRLPGRDLDGGARVVRDDGVLAGQAPEDDALADVRLADRGRRSGRPARPLAPLRPAAVLVHRSKRYCSRRRGSESVRDTPSCAAGGCSRMPTTRLVKQASAAADPGVPGEVRAHYRAHARSMPWRETRDPYRILVSEVMLQQTQVDRVRAKYEEFLAAFPDFAALAGAPLERVLAAWQGLGYNRRAVALHRGARIARAASTAGCSRTTPRRSSRCRASAPPPPRRSAPSPSTRRWSSSRPTSAGSSSTSSSPAARRSRTPSCCRSSRPRSTGARRASGTMR